MDEVEFVMDGGCWLRVVTDGGMTPVFVMEPAPFLDDGVGMTVGRRILEVFSEFNDDGTAGSLVD